MRLEFTVAQPERRDDGSFRYPVQVVVQTVGRWEKGVARFELVGWASDLAHVKKLQGFLR